MDRDSIIRRACLIAVPALAVAAYLLRGAPPRHPPKSAPVAVASSSANQPAIEPELDPVPQDGPPRGPPSVAAPVVPPPRARVAVDLPPAASSVTAPEHARPRGACGGIEARLITASDDPKWSFATLAIDSNDPGAIRHVGDRVGHWRVARIEWNRVLLQAGRHRCAVPLFEGDSAHDKPGASHDGITLAAAEGAAPRWFVPDSIASGIDQRSQTEYVLSPEAITAIFKRAADLLSGLGLQAVHRDGAVVGLRFRTIPLDSLLERLGLEQDDVLLALNDAPATSLDSVRDALEKARAAGSLVAHLEREDQAFDVSIRARSADAQ
jgi:general secretion pathway protein C